MPRLILSERAAAGLMKCRRFLAEKNPAAADRAGREIARRLHLLETFPAIGRPYAREPSLRELVIQFGNSGYVALYRHSPDDDEVVVLAIKHQREAGY